MDCPNCASPMRTSSHGQLQTRRCDGCRCAWHLLPDPKYIPKLEAGGTLTVLPPAGNNMHCPGCSKELIPFRNNFRPELHCRLCRGCGGVLLDAPATQIDDPFELSRLSMTLFLTLRSRAQK